MEPSGTGRVRGFRAPRPDELKPDEAGPDGAEAELPGSVPTLGRWSRFASSWRWFIGACSVLLVAIVAIVVIAALAFRLGSSSPTATGRTSPTPTPAPASTATPLATTDLYKQVEPSVVLIATSKGALGSGTILTDTGSILTANHVISDGSDLTVLFADGTRSPATVASRSKKTDTAVVIPTKLPEVVVPAVLGGGVAVGADVVAIGNPLGLRMSTTTGVVSGLDRTSKTAAGTVSGTIQFDAAVNPGSSGGPLLDDKGNVIGVVLAIADPGKDDAFAGIGFAVPIGSALGGGGDGAGQGGGPQL